MVGCVGSMNSLIDQFKANESHKSCTSGFLKNSLIIRDNIKENFVKTSREGFRYDFIKCVAQANGAKVIWGVCVI